MKYKPTKDDFDYFKRRVDYWAHKLNLDRKNIYVSFKKEEPGVIASIVALDDGYASFNVTMSTRPINCGEDTKENIKTILDKTALHEVVHCVLCDVEKIAYSRFIANKSTVDCAFEDLTELLTKVIYGE